jgi:peptidoglycan/xylan/chitin deacetylase (PgdA/CDA1 family)
MNAIVKKRIKALLGFLVFSSGLHKLILRNRCLVVAFHRVSDDAENSSINCTPNEFRRYCEFLRRHFSVVPLSEVVNRLQAKRSLSGIAAITFDDGYDDNANAAAPILDRLDLPATFFVATNFIGSRTQAFWDVQDEIESKWMSWDDVRALHAGRHDIGCHTENHVDLGSVEIAEAAAEIENSKRVLENALGAEVRHFAYPFGGKQHIRPDTRALVEAAGFDCCLSCHGGFVRDDSDPFDLPREPITTWHESPYQFGFELLFQD